MQAPIPVSDATPISANVGTYLNVITPGVTKVTTDNPGVLEVSQPHSDGSATFNAGAKLIGPGTSKLTVIGGATNSTMYAVTVSSIPN